MSAQPNPKWLAWNLHEKRMAPVVVVNVRQQMVIVELPEGDRAWDFWMIELLEWTGIGEGDREVYEGEVWEIAGFVGVVVRREEGWYLKDSKSYKDIHYRAVTEGMTYLGNKFEQPELVTN